jgi:hypothetical protein
MINVQVLQSNTISLSVKELAGTLTSVDASRVLTAGNLVPPVAIYGDSFSRTINFILDGGGLELSTGSKGFIVVDFDSTIASWTLLSDVACSLQVDIKKANTAAFPNTVSIVGAAPPYLTNEAARSNTVLTGWNTTINTGDVLEIVVNSASLLTRATLALKVTVT